MAKTVTQKIVGTVSLVTAENGEKSLQIVSGKNKAVISLSATSKDMRKIVDAIAATKKADAEVEK
jgi:hypothetical protein